MRALLRGRGAELSQINEVLERARHGLSGVLVILGAAGYGKTSVLDRADELAPDFRVTRAAGTETEMQLGYAGLHQLLRAHLAQGLHELAAPQRRAIETAFGLREGSRPDPFLVGLATLDLLSRSGSHQPLLCLIDDVQWLDSETTLVLAFVGRRLLADSVGLIMAARPGAGWRPPTDLPTHELASLTDDDALSIVRAATTPQIAPAVADALVAQAAGNPLALTEIPAILDADQRAGRTPLPTPLPVGPRLGQSLAHTLDLLPTRSRAILLLAAADPTGSANLLWRAADATGLSRADLAAAEEAAVVTVDEAIRFRHPLLRSAAYWAADPIERRVAHGVIAAVMPAQQNVALHAWHRAKAADGPDEDVAAALEDAGDRAMRHGATSGAATSYRMAADFSIASAAHMRRALKAADTLSTIGATAAAEEMLNRAVHELPASPTAPVMAEVGRLRGRVLFQQGRPSDATSAILQTARSVAAEDVRTARDILIEAMAQSLISERLAPRGATITDLAVAAHDLPLPAAAVRTLPDVLLDAYVAYFRVGLPAAGPGMRAAIEAVVRDPRGGPDMLPWIRAAATAAGFLGDHEVQWMLAQRLHREAAALDDVEGRYRAMVILGNLSLVGGRLRDAENFFAEVAAIEQARGRPFSYGHLLVAAWRGDRMRTAELYDAVIEEATQYEQGYQLPRAAWARAIVSLATGDDEAAYLALAPYAGTDSTMQYALPDTIEAAVRAKRFDDARRIHAVLTHVAESNPQDRLLGYVARCRALIDGDGVEAEAGYVEAVERHRDERRPSHEARSRLVYGEWLRRARRLRDARAQLHPAHAAFQRSGMGGFATRAAAELRLAGVRTSAIAPSQRPKLSEQEADVARLAASGITNIQIASQLFISASTVDYHLRKVFRKLSISSRRDLPEALDDT